MKISNETKVGALTAVAITVLVLGFNALKGKSLFNKPKKIYAIFDKTPGLPNTAPVYYKGLQIGVTGEVTEVDEMVSQIIVPITLTKKILLPKNSIAVISSNPLGISSSVIDIQPGNDTKNFITPGDTLQTKATADIIAEVTKQINPVLFEVKSAVHSLDSVLMIIGNTFDPNTKSNFQGILSNVNRTTANLIKTSVTLQELLAAQSANLNKSLTNVASFTDNLTKQNDKISATLSNIEKASNNVAKLKLDEPITNLNKTITELQQVIGKFNNDNGTMGLLLKDPDLYHQLHSLTYSLNTLIDDLKVNPKRYISIFGRKDKKIKPLTKPLSDTLTP